TGFAVSAPVASALLTGCKADAEMLEPGFKPAFFSQEEYDYIAKVADLMLPSDGTPGALDVGVPQTIDKMVGEVFAKEDAERNRKGLQELIKSMEADGFSSLEGDKALAYLQEQDEQFKSDKGETTMSGEDVPQEIAVETAGNLVKNTYFGLKSMIIGNYFNSEEVATTMLAYDPVPGEYIPCGDLQELTGGKAWAL
ncbi:MAG: gluconate 2-dehydrogenase subunit 3 family protein, partial [Bacteroidota bacterium]